MVRCALSVAGSDPIGGAGIQADIKAMASLGVHPFTVITAVTSQNTSAVSSIMPVPCDVILSQLESVFEDSAVSSMKTGMLYSLDIVRTVAEFISDIGIPAVTDPVLIAGVGDSLASGDLAEAIKKELMPVCDLITPNKYEAEAISGIRINDEDDAMRACELMGKNGNSVYIKGGHIESASVVDILYHGAEFKRFEYPRLERAGHGGGCTLSAYITANLAKGIDMVSSVLNSREMIQRAIASMYSVGKGNKIVNSAVNIRQAYADDGITAGMSGAVDSLLRIVPASWIQPSGTNVAYAKADACTPDDVAAVSGRIVLSGGRPVRNGDIRFGAAEHTGFIIMAAMRYDPDMRAAMSIRYDSGLLDTMEEVGLMITPVDRRKYPELRIGELTMHAIKKAGAVPDIIYDKGANKKGPMIWMLGTDIADLRSKTERIV